MDGGGSVEADSRGDGERRVQGVGEHQRAGRGAVGGRRCWARPGVQPGLLLYQFISRKCPACSTSNYFVGEAEKDDAEYYAKVQQLNQVMAACSKASKSKTKGKKKSKPEPEPEDDPDATQLDGDGGGVDNDPPPPDDSPPPAAVAVAVAVVEAVAPPAVEVNAVAEAVAEAEPVLAEAVHVHLTGAERSADTQGAFHSFIFVYQNNQGCVPPA